MQPSQSPLTHETPVLPAALMWEEAVAQIRPPLINLWKREITFPMTSFARRMRV